MKSELKQIFMYGERVLISAECMDYNHTECIDKNCECDFCERKEIA